MSELRVDNIVSEDGSTSPVYSKGMTIGAGQTLTCAGDFTVQSSVNFNQGAHVAGIVTFASGIDILSSGGLDVGGVNVSGVSTFSAGSNFSGILRENVNITAGKLSDNTNIDLENGMVHYFTTTETTTSTPNIRFSSSSSLNSVLDTGDAISVIIITTAATAGFSSQVTIDGSAVTEYWSSGLVPDEGGSGLDVYGYSIIKTADATFTVIGNLNKFS